MRIQALIIKKQNTNEYDQLVTCYSKEVGKFTAIAKSVLKHGSMQAMHLDLLNLVDFELINGRAMPIIAAAQAEKSYLRIKESLLCLGAAAFFLEVVDRMVFDHQKDEHLWRVLIETLDAFEQLSDERQALSLFRARQLELLKVMGYAVQTDRCTLCHGKELAAGPALALELGGLLCRDCFLRGGRGVLLTRDEVALVKGEATANVSLSKPAKSVIDSIFEYTAGMQFNSLKFLYQVCATGRHAAFSIPASS